MNKVGDILQRVLKLSMSPPLSASQFQVWSNKHGLVRVRRNRCQIQTGQAVAAQRGNSLFHSFE